MTSASTADVAAGLGQLLTPTDEVTFTGDLARWLAETMRRAGAQGVIGVRDDGLALVAPWGFDVSSISVPTAVWAGGQDATVPYAHGQWLAANVPGAVAHLFDDAGTSPWSTTSRRCSSSSLNWEGGPSTSGAVGPPRLRRAQA